jgi:hypothetical protein
MCRKNTCPWTDSIMRREKIKFVCRRCTCDYMWLRATTQGVEKMVTELKGVQHSDESLYAEPHHYTMMSDHFKAPADLHRKRNRCYKLVDPRAGLDVSDKKSLPSTGMRSSFPKSSGPLRSLWNNGDIGVHIIAYASEIEPEYAQFRSYGCALHTVCRGRKDRNGAWGPGPYWLSTVMYFSGHNSDVMLLTGSYWLTI